MNKYNSETEFQIAKRDSGSGTLIYNLRQDGYRKGKPNMVNDVTIQINGHNLSLDQYDELEQVIITALNERYTEPEISSMEEFYGLYFQKRHQFEEQRDGQYIYNLMYEVNPIMAKKYNGTEIDPFYNNAVIVDFIKACFSNK